MNGLQHVEQAVLMGSLFLASYGNLLIMDDCGFSPKSCFNGVFMGYVMLSA